MKYGAEDVADVAREPDDDEEDGEAICGVAAEVFQDLGGEDYDPAGDGDGSGVVLLGFESERWVIGGLTHRYR